MFVLEQRERAMARGARVYAEIVGFGNGHDAFNPVTPHPDGRGLQVALRAALREAESNPSDIGYIAAHGSGTQLGDASEARAIRAVFGSAAERLAASSVKPATGHLMGGGGALNVAVGALALHHQVAPPTLNLENLDPVCELDWIPGRARALPAEQVIAVARGFEGQNIALALRAAN